MTRKMALLLLVMFAVCPLFSLAQTSNPSATAQKAAKPKLFDPTRNAEEDLRAAIAEAAQSNKRVLVDVGGNWCSWCHEMERFVLKDKELLALRDNNYVTVKINFSPENENKSVLSRYPKIAGYPHLFVLDQNGLFLHSQNTSELEDGVRSYDRVRFVAFLKKWAPAGQ